MNEGQIIRAIWHEWGQRSMLMCPRFTPRNWWECDVWRVTKAGHVVEYEIKTTMKDFKADAAKFQKRFHKKPGGQWFEGQDVVEKKHDLLAAGDARGPGRFFFVVLRSLGITVEMVPPWAGLLTYAPRAPGNYEPRFREEKGAPYLHREKASEEVVTQARISCYYRFWQMMSRTPEPKILDDFSER